MPLVSLTPAAAQDADALADLRVRAMRESLERIGRFDPTRARERFLSNFDLANTRHIEVDGKRVGFLVVLKDVDQLTLDHLYLDPHEQNRGVGAAVLRTVFDEADASQLPLRVGALRESDSNRFYVRHGFALVDESEFDLYYERRPASVERPMERSRRDSD